MLSFVFNTFSFMIDQSVQINKMHGRNRTPYMREMRNENKEDSSSKTFIPFGTNANETRVNLGTSFLLRHAASTDLVLWVKHLCSCKSYKALHTLLLALSGQGLSCLTLEMLLQNCTMPCRTWSMCCSVCRRHKGTEEHIKYRRLQVFGGLMTFFRVSW